MDSIKTELIADRVWQTHTQLELAIVNTSPGSTPAGCTRRSVISRPQSSRPSPLYGSRQSLTQTTAKTYKPGLRGTRSSSGLRSGWAKPVGTPTAGARADLAESGTQNAGATSRALLTQGSHGARWSRGYGAFAPAIALSRPAFVRQGSS